MKWLLILAMPIVLQAQEQQPAPCCLQRAAADRSYNHDRLILMVQDNSRARAEYLIRACGVSVPFTPELEGELRAGNAVENVIGAVREVAPKAGPKPGETKFNSKDSLTYVWIRQVSS